YGNARPHVVSTTVQKLHKLGIEILSHPLYFPDLSPTDFLHFFRTLNNFLMQKRFKKQKDIENVFLEIYILIYAKLTL
ncbi:Histone-lysine N-methyltransferase SETMAR, partial [Habropoda laboriosa]